MTNAHNLAMVALTSRIQHEFNYTDDFLKTRGLRRLNINPKTATMGWAMDFCAQSLRNIIIGMGGKMDGFMCQSKFGIAVSSEVMAILSIFNGLEDFKKRLNEIFPPEKAAFFRLREKAWWESPPEPQTQGT